MKTLRWDDDCNNSSHSRCSRAGGDALSRRQTTSNMWWLMSVLLWMMAMMMMTIMSLTLLQWIPTVQVIYSYIHSAQYSHTLGAILYDLCIISIRVIFVGYNCVAYILHNIQYYATQ